MKISDSKYGMILSLPGLAIIIALVVIPVIILFWTGFMQYVSWKPRVFNGIENYNYIFHDRIFWLSFQKTFIYCFGVTVLTGVVGIVLALCLSRITRGSTLFRTLAMFPWAVPLVISGFIWKWIFNPNVGVFSDLLMKVGLISKPLPIFSNPTLAMIGTIVGYAWVQIPFMTIFALAGIEHIPQELYDSAKVDGADYIDRFRYITWPLMKRTALVGLLIISMFSFRTIDVIFSMTEGGPARGTYVLGLYIVDQLWLKVNYGVSCAASVVMFILIAGFATIYLRQILGET